MQAPGKLETSPGDTGKLALALSVASSYYARSSRSSYTNFLVPEPPPNLGIFGRYWPGHTKHHS